MRNVLAIASRDIRSGFVSPIAYVVLTGFQLLAGWFFFNMFGQFNRMVAQYSSVNGADTTWLNLNDAVIAPLLGNLSIILVIVTPMITMRSFAEEKSNSTYELLFTSPITVTEIVLGKYLAGAFLITVMIGLTLLFPAILLVFGNPEIPMAACGYLGLYLMGLSFIAVGNFTSALTSNQIVATISSLVIILILYVVNWAGEGAGEALRPFINYLSITDHFRSMTQGMIQSQNIVYFTSLILVFLFLTHRAVESQRWK